MIFVRDQNSMSPQDWMGPVGSVGEKGHNYG